MSHPPRQLLGHKDVKTTMIYTLVLNRGPSGHQRFHWRVLLGLRLRRRRYQDPWLGRVRPGQTDPPLRHIYTCHTTRFEHVRGRHVCPLRFPEVTASICPVGHKNWPKGGCTTTLLISIGARIRHQLDRDSAVYKEVYKQRTATERINSQAKELGIERPRLRSGQAIANLNTLIYVLINLRALHRVQQKKHCTVEQ